MYFFISIAFFPRRKFLWRGFFIFAGMKARFFVIGLFLFALIACTEKTQVPEPAVAEHGRSVEGPSPELSAVDSLMWHQPDSALMRLLPYFNDTCCRDVSRNVSENANNDTLEDVSGNVSTTMTYNRHYAHLLLAELLYKNDYAQTNRTELLQAVTYFDSLVRQAGGARRAGDSKTTSNLAFLDARAHYINGVGYYEQDSLVQACAEYLKTLEVMESHFNENELIGHKARFMAYTYNRLGDMFYGQLLADPAIVCYRNALTFCFREPTSKYGVSVIMYNLGIQFDIAGLKDSADYYYNKALDYMSDFDNIHYRDIITTKSVLAYNLGFCVDTVIKDLRYVISLTTNNDERLTRFLTLGNILFEDNQYDSARFYLETVFEQKEDIQSKILAAENLCSIYQMEGDSIKVQKYASFLAGFTMTEIEKKTDVSKINEMFQDYLKQKQEKLSEKERENSIRKIVGTIVPITISVVLAIIIFAKTRSKKQLRDKEKHHQQEMESARQTHKMQQAALSGRLKRSNEELRDISKQLEETLAKNSLSESETSDDYSAFVNSPVCLYIIRLAHTQQFKSKIDYLIYKESALSKEQILALRDAAEKHLSRFKSYTRKQFPNLTDNDMDYCYLFLLGLGEADISALMQRAYTTVCDRSRKISRIIGDNNSLYQALRNMLHEN